MQSQISQYGNSLAIRIPKPFAADLGIAKGSRVDLSVQDGKLIIEIIKPERVKGTPPQVLLQFVGKLPQENTIEIDTLITEAREQIDEKEW